MARIEWQSASVREGAVAVTVAPTQVVEASMPGERGRALLSGGCDHEVRELRPYLVEARRWNGEQVVEVHCIDAALARQPLVLGFWASGCPQAKVGDGSQARTFANVTSIELGPQAIAVTCESELGANGQPLPAGVMVDQQVMDELAELRQARPALEARVAQLEADLDAARRTASQAQRDAGDRARLLAQIEGLRSDNEALQRTLRSQAESRVSGAAVQREGLERQLAEKLEAADQAERQLADLSAQVAAAQSRVEELEREAAGRRAQIGALDDVANLTDEDIARLDAQLDSLARRMGYDQGSVELMASDPYLTGGSVAEALQQASEQLDLAEQRMVALTRTREAYLMRVQSSITTTSGDGTIALSDELRRGDDGV